VSPLLWHGQGRAKYSMAYLMSSWGLLLPDTAAAALRECAAGGGRVGADGRLLVLPGDDGRFDRGVCAGG